MGEESSLRLLTMVDILKHKRSGSPPSPPPLLPFCGKEERAPCDSTLEHCMLHLKAIAIFLPLGQHWLVRSKGPILLSAARHTEVQRV